MRRLSVFDLGETIASVLVAVLVAGYGWLTLLNGGVSVGGGVRGVVHTAYLSGDEAGVYTGAAFLTAAVVSFFSVWRMSRRKAISCAIALAVLLHPLLYVAVAG